MAGSTIAVSITGDSTSFTKAAQTAGKSATDFGKEAEEGGSKLGEFNENVEGSTKAFRGTADLVDGVTSSLSTFGINIPGQQVIGLARGLADLADGFSTVVGPALEKVTAKLGFTTAATEAESAATGEAAVAQEGLNTAFLLSPIGLILVGLAALAAAFYILWQKSGTFRDIVKDIGGYLKTGFLEALNGIVDVVKVVGDAISGAFKGAFNLVADIWNSTVGQLHFSIPGWVPGIGGDSFGVPSIPHFAAGGTMMTGGLAVVGEAGKEIVALPGGSQVFDANRSAGMLGGDQTILNIDLGKGITQRIAIDNRDIRNAVKAGSRRAL